MNPVYDGLKTTTVRELIDALQALEKDDYIVLVADWGEEYRAARPLEPGNIRVNDKQKEIEIEGTYS